MKKFLMKNSFYFISTIFDDSSTILNDITPQELWTEIEKTLFSMSRLNKFFVLLSLLCISFIIPPYGFFNIFYKSSLKRRKKWLNAWAESKFSLIKYAFIGLRIILYGSFSQIPAVMEKSEYLNTSLMTRDYKLNCSDIILPYE